MQPLDNLACGCKNTEYGRRWQGARTWAVDSYQKKEREAQGSPLWWLKFFNTNKELSYPVWSLSGTYIPYAIWGQDKAKISGIRSWNELHTWANDSLLLQAIALPEEPFFDCLYFYWKKINSCSKVPNGWYTYVMQGASNGNDITRDYLSKCSSICIDYKDRKNTIPSAHHMFGIPISLQTPSISPSEFIPQIFFIRLTTSSPQISRIWSDASPRLYFSVCE